MYHNKLARYLLGDVTLPRSNTEKLNLKLYIILKR